jgi:hypothetical protein
MRVRILTSAFNDLAAGREFYDRQGEGVGAYFFNSLFSEIDSLSIFGGIHRKSEGLHRMLARRFPYALYYKMGVRWLGSCLSRFGLPAGPGRNQVGTQIEPVSRVVLSMSKCH